MARYLLSVHTVEGERRPPMSNEEMQQFMQRISTLEGEMNDALLFSGRLHDASTATVVRLADGEVITTDGPFVESREHLGGFYVIEADDLDAALDWASKTSACVLQPIEVRPLWDDSRS